MSSALSDVLANAEYCKAGYGVLTEAESEAVRMFARYEGLLLDPVYTGRAAAGLIDLIRKGFFKKDETVLFWHTGGQPALFAENYANVNLIRFYSRQVRVSDAPLPTSQPLELFCSRNKSLYNSVIVAS